MAISDWTSQIDGNYAFLLETTNPVSGTGSLRLERNSGSGVEGAIVYPTNLNTGLTKGRLQTVINLSEVSNDGSGQNQHVGVFFMINSLSDPLNTSSMYSFTFGVRSIGSAVINLGKSVGAGINGLVVNALNTKAIPFIPLGTDIALQVDWVYDAIQFSGTKITARWKLGNDFTGLETVFDQVDTVSPLTTSVAEGLGALTGTGSNDWVMLFDDTSLFDLVPV